MDVVLPKLEKGCTVQLPMPDEPVNDELAPTVGARPLDSTIGRLDRVLSELMLFRDAIDAMDAADRQTLKHHAEDMAGAARSILESLGVRSAELDGPRREKALKALASLSIARRHVIVELAKVGGRIVSQSPPPLEHIRNPDIVGEDGTLTPLGLDVASVLMERSVYE